MDDTGAHCETARNLGINAIQFIGWESFIRDIRLFSRFCDLIVTLKPGRIFICHCSSDFWRPLWTHCNKKCTGYHVTSRARAVILYR